MKIENELLEYYSANVKYTQRIGAGQQPVDVTFPLLDGRQWSIHFNKDDEFPVVLYDSSPCWFTVPVEKDAPIDEIIQYILEENAGYLEG